MKNKLARMGRGRASQPQYYSETLILTEIGSVYSKNITKAEHIHENRLYEVRGLKANEYPIK